MVKFLNEKSCFIGDNVEFGENIIIYENCHIGNNVKIGNNTIIHPSCHIGNNVTIGENVLIYENNHIGGNCQIGKNTTLLPANFVETSQIGQKCKLHNSVIENAIIKDNVQIGPFARIRPNSIIENDAKVGNFVEIKNSKIGSGCKISHLAYVGDAELGQNCNVGCGVIFANYNGKEKNKTIVKEHVFIGSNCNIIAPVVIEKDSYICAGTTVTNNIAEGDMAIGRSRQENKNGYAKKYW